jgi:hypothetical protein
MGSDDGLKTFITLAKRITTHVLRVQKMTGGIVLKRSRMQKEDLEQDWK